MTNIDLERSRKIIKDLIKAKFGSQKNFCILKNEHEGNLSKTLNNTDLTRQLTVAKIIELEQKLEVPFGSILYPDMFKLVELPCYDIEAAAGNGSYFAED